jgi:signal peptidase I
MPSQLAPPSAAPARRVSLGRELVIILVVALTLSWFLKTFLVQSFYIPSGSMEQTLLIGDRILVDKLSFGRELHRGDIVVFEDPGGWTGTESGPTTSGVSHAVRGGLEFLGLAPVAKGHLVKRVIGMAGDRIVCCDATGKLTVNGIPLDEPYLFPGDVPSQAKFDITVPAGGIWVMGDHRSMSQDSRAHLTEPDTRGIVPADLVVGRVFFVVWPISSAGGVGTD